MVIERFGTYAGADPRRAPAALAVAGYVEHAYGAWHVRGGIYELVRALERELVALGGEVRYGARVEGLLRRTSGAVRGVGTSSGAVDADWVLWNGDALGLDGLLVRRRAPWPRIERSLSGFVTLLGVRGPTAGLAHHTIAFPRDYDAEFDDVFVRRRPVVEPTLYVSTSSITDRRRPRGRRELVRPGQRAGRPAGVGVGGLRGARPRPPGRRRPGPR
jgi:phytoene dehydrogenase-like protein